MKTQILITGGAGFIGSHFVDFFLKDKNNEIIIIDDLSTGSKVNIASNNNIFFEEGDVSDPSFVDNVFRKYSFNYIYHLAAVASVKRTIEDPLRTHKVNFDSTLYLLEKSRSLKNLYKFIFASSAAIYGDKEDLPCVETDRPNPLSPYGVDKYFSEYYVSLYNKLYNIPTVAFRFFNVYGERQNPSSPYSGVLSIFIDRIKKNEEITIYGDGTQTRDFIYVKDLVDMVVRVVNSGRDGEVFNIATGSEISLLDILMLFEKILGKKIDVCFEQERVGDIKRSVANISKIGSNFDLDFTSIECFFRQILDR